MEGHYFCRVRADMPNSEEISSEEVEVTIAPFLSDIIEQPEGVNRQEGETICLKCIIESAYPAPSYEWYKGNQRLDNHTKSVLYVSIYKNTLK